MASDTIKVEWLDEYGSWKGHGGGRPDTIKETKKEAVGESKALAKRDGKRLKVFKKDGSLQNTFDYRDNSGSSGGGLGGMLGF